MSSALESSLGEARHSGRKLLVPYVTGGFGEDWLDVVRAAAAAGADAVEVGIPFSDPVMDGPVIQEASRRALEAGATPPRIIRDLKDADVEIPIVVMTYVNIVAHAGYTRMASWLAESNVAGAVVPDLPVDECGEWAAAADLARVATVLLAAPTSGDDRLKLICARSRGFVYAVGALGVTGERRSLSSSATSIAGRLKAMTDLPVLVGVGVSTPDQAAEVCAVADGVIVGSALVRRLLDGGGPEAAGAFVAELRSAIGR